MSCSRTQRSDAGEAQTPTPQSRVKHCTTDPLCSLLYFETKIKLYMENKPEMYLNRDKCIQTFSFWDVISLSTHLRSFIKPTLKLQASCFIEFIKQGEEKI